MPGSKESDLDVDSEDDDKSLAKMLLLNADELPADVDEVGNTCPEECGPTDDSDSDGYDLC